MQISLTTYIPIQIINVVNRKYHLYINILRFDSVNPKAVKNNNVILQISPSFLNIKILLTFKIPLYMYHMLEIREVENSSKLIRLCTNNFAGTILYMSNVYKNIKRKYNATTFPCEVYLYQLLANKLRAI